MTQIAVLLAVVLGGCSRSAPPPSERAAPVERAAPAAPVERAAPPATAGALVDVAAVIPDAVLDIRYATPHNFTGATIYPVARCLLRPGVAERLAAAAKTLRASGYRLLLWDCYRPMSVQRILWSRVPHPDYVAEPKFDAGGRPIAGSVHSRGAAVDISLADASGAPLAMPTEHDHFGPAAHRNHRVADPAVRARAAALERAMTAAGFVGLPTEWWHYDAADGARYSLLDEPLS